MDEVLSVKHQKLENTHRVTSQDEYRTHSDDGVDLTLIRWMLSLTPTERLMTLQNTIRSFKRLTDGVREP
jgi:hypothetical protein